MRRRLGYAAWVLVPALLVLGLASWVTGVGLGGATGWVSDGEAANTFFERGVVTVPGLAIVEVHCHGKMRYAAVVGDGPGSSLNPCMRSMPGHQYMSIEHVLDVSETRALFRYRVNRGPWKYFTSEQDNGWPPGMPTPPSRAYPTIQPPPTPPH